jgi:hypothetical protein
MTTDRDRAVILTGGGLRGSQPVTDTAVYLFDYWFDPIAAQVRVFTARRFNVGVLATLRMRIQ